MTLVAASERTAKVVLVISTLLVPALVIGGLSSAWVTPALWSAFVILPLSFVVLA